jgi:hypothetical protein
MTGHVTGSLPVIVSGGDQHERTHPRPADHGRTTRTAIPDFDGRPPSHCDFCHTTGRALRAYACHPFTILVIQSGDTLRCAVVGSIATTYRPAPGDGAARAVVSLGGWAACDACAAVIDAGDRPGLGRRMVACLAGDDLPPAHRIAAERQVQAALGGFRRHRPCTN